MLLAEENLIEYYTYRPHSPLLGVYPTGGYPAMESDLTMNMLSDALCRQIGVTSSPHLAFAVAGDPEV
jgi:hypothetical protein